jgi:hypothetical protein
LEIGRASGGTKRERAVTVEGTYDGKDQSGTYNAGSVWNKQNGEWQAIFHTNIKQAPAGG